MHLIRPRSNITRVRRDDDGELAGIQVEHWDDQVDATALARPQRLVISRAELEVIRAANRERGRDPRCNPKENRD